MTVGRRVEPRTARAIHKRMQRLRIDAKAAEAEHVRLFARLTNMGTDTHTRLQIASYPVGDGRAMRARMQSWWRDPLVLDLLSQCVLEDGHWLWTGPVKASMKHTPIFRLGSSDRTVQRWLADAAGLIDADEDGFVWRGVTCPVGCVNPWHAYVGGVRLGGEASPLDHVGLLEGTPDRPQGQVRSRPGVRLHATGGHDPGQPRSPMGRVHRVPPHEVGCTDARPPNRPVPRGNPRQMTS